jgi:hypothetical protein
MTQTEPPAATTNPTRKTGGRRKIKPSCERCYFGRRGLCALELGEPCSTFRPDSPEGLVPPTQPTLLARAEPEPVDARSEPVMAAA